MDRIILIQSIFASSNFENYLEIGCRHGSSFLPIKAKNKKAVDPNFRITLRRKAYWYLKNFNNFGNQYFEKTSDEFFQNDTNQATKLDVVLVDGLHTFFFSLKDVLNSLKYLNKDGVIVMHDCYPKSEAAALATKSYPTPEEQASVEGFTGPWNGDVYKTIRYLLERYPEELDVCTLDTDHGLGVVRLKKDKSGMDLSIDQSTFDRIDKLTFTDLTQDPTTFLNLKPQSYAQEVIKSISNA